MTKMFAHALSFLTRWNINTKDEGFALELILMASCSACLSPTVLNMLQIASSTDLFNSLSLEFELELNFVTMAHLSLSTLKQKLAARLFRVSLQIFGQRISPPDFK